MCCTKCGGQNVVKSGFVKEQQRYRCKDCCYQFVPTRHHGKSEQEKNDSSISIYKWFVANYERYLVCKI